MFLSLKLRLLKLAITAGCIALTSMLAGGSASAEESLALKDAGSLRVDEVLAESGELAGKRANSSRRHALANRAASLLLSDELWDRGEYTTIRLLSVAAQPAIASLTEEQKAKLEKLLATLAATGDTAAFDQLQMRVSLLNSTGKHDDAAVKAVETWLSARDISSLDAEQIAWCISEGLPTRSNVKQFTATWIGTITAPRSGNYEFSTTPINVNRAGRDFVKHSLIATVGEVEVLHTPQEPPTSSEQLPSAPIGRAVAEWKSVGSTVALTANQPTPVRIEMRYEAAQPSIAAPASAIFCWKGPGLERQPVAAKALAGPNGEAGGLHAEYHWSEAGQVQRVDQESTVVDAVWPTPASIAPANPQLIKQLSDRLWSLAMDEEYLERCEAGQEVPVYGRQPGVAGLLSSSRRQEFADLLAARPELLEKMSGQQLLLLYRNVRFGAEEASIDLLGAWMQQHADIQPEIVVNFFERNRRIYWELAQSLAQQPSGLDRLRDEYLVMDDERCALPVAYTLTYGYRQHPREAALRTDARIASSPSQSWLSLLDEKLADDSIVGDARVNWLIAKAQALEVGNAAPEETAVSREDYLVSAEWLTEAHLTAEDKAIQSRIYAEEVARAVALDRREAAHELIRKASEAVSDVEASSWMRAADAASKLWQVRQANDAQAARGAYVKALQRRREQAIARGNEQSVRHYDGLLRRSSPETN